MSSLKEPPRDDLDSVLAGWSDSGDGAPPESEPVIIPTPTPKVASAVGGRAVSSRFPTGAYAIIASPGDDSAGIVQTGFEDTLGELAGYASGKRLLEHIAVSNQRFSWINPASDGLKAGIECLFRTYGNVDAPSIVALRTEKTLQVLDEPARTICFRRDYVFNRRHNHIEMRVTEIDKGVDDGKEISYPYYKIEFFANKCSWTWQLIDMIWLAWSKFKHGRIGLGVVSDYGHHPAKFLNHMDVEFSSGSGNVSNRLNIYKAICGDNKKRYEKVSSLLKRLAQESETPGHYLAVATVDSLVALPDVFFSYFNSKRSR